MATSPSGGQHSFAVSTHRSALHCLGFDSASIKAVPPGVMQVYNLPGRREAALVEAYSVGLQGLLQAGAKQPGGGSLGEFNATVKRAVGQLLRDSAALSGDRLGGRPRLLLFALDRPSGCLASEGLLYGSLAALPLPFLLYRLSANRTMLRRFILGPGARGDRKVAMDVLDLSLGDELLSSTEP
jgi:hypothetical protein